MAAKIYEVSILRDKRFVFKDRDDAGKMLSEMLKPYYKRPSSLQYLPVGCL